MRILNTLFLSALFILGSVSVLTAQSSKDTIGDIVIQPIVHGTLAIYYQGHTIYVDPYGGADKFEGVPEASLILVTDIHGDHYDESTLKALPTEGSHLVVPPAVGAMLPENMAKEVSVLKNGEHKEIGGISIETLPMYNLPETEESRHPKGRGNGYVLTLGDKRIYISGDTEDIPEMRALKNIDIAFVCMNMPYTMTVDQAASAVNEFKPAIVYPYHYRGRPDMSDTEKFKTLVEKENKVTEVRLRNWYSE